VEWMWHCFLFNDAAALEDETPRLIDNKLPVDPCREDSRAFTGFLAGLTSFSEKIS